LACYGNKEVVVLPMAEQQGNILGMIEANSMIRLDNRLETILSIHIVSSDEETYRLDVAAKLKNHNIVVIYDSAIEIDFNRQIVYHSSSEKILVKISTDFDEVTLSSKFETYLLRQQGNEYTQSTVFWLKEKEVEQILAIKDEFLYICHYSYDKRFHVYSSGNESFCWRIPQSIAPNSVKILDVAMTNIDLASGLGREMAMIVQRECYFFYHMSNPQHALSKGDEAYKYSIFIETCGTMQSMWPYFACSGLMNSLWIYCAFD
jgi:hypothetical protein